jgi:hypothetical protein
MSPNGAGEDSPGHRPGNANIRRTGALKGRFRSVGAWDVGFEAKGKFWVYACVRLVGDRIEGCTCDT